MDAIADHRARARELDRLIEDRFPFEGPARAWPTVAHALLAQVALTVRSILALGDEQARGDGARLVRSLLDHVVSFAWIAADPETNLPLWLKRDLEQRVAIAQEDPAAAPVWSPSDVVEWRRQLAATAGDAGLTLLGRARAADARWGDALDGGSSLTELYTQVFRDFSGFVHATPRGLGGIVEEDAGQARIALRYGQLGASPCEVAVDLYETMLRLSAAGLGFPDADALRTLR